MLDILKRHAFLFALGGGVVVIALAVGLLTYFVYMGPNAEVRDDLDAIVLKARALVGGTIFSASLVEEMKTEVDQRGKQYDALMEELRTLGADRKPLVEGLFPTSTEISLRHSFKSAYDRRLDEFMDMLGAGFPMMPEGRRRRDPDAAGEIEAAHQEALQHTMYAHPRNSFSRPAWVEASGAPSLAECRDGQEDIWLMADLVRTMAAMNRDVLQQRRQQNAEVKAVIAYTPLKELVGIDVGSRTAVLPKTDMPNPGVRYRPVDVRGGRVATLSGLTSAPGFYQVLPWRLDVVVEARYAGELLRRLRGTESFLSIEGTRMTPITYAVFESANDLLAYQREDYGTEGVVRMQVVGESLVFQLQGGRITTPAAGDAPEGDPENTKAEGA